MGQSLDRPVTDKTSFSGESENFRYGVSKMQGWRNTMEDSECCEPKIDNWLDGWGYFAIFDGHAGSKASEICSKELLSRIISHALKLQNQTEESIELDDSLDTDIPREVLIMKKALHDGFIDFDDSMKDLQSFKSTEPSCGTTALAVVISPTHIIFSNCGDSRGILVRGDSLYFETKDHKPSDPEERNRIEAAGGSVYMDRVNGNLAVSRALGDYGFKNNSEIPSIKQAVSPEPTVTVIPRSEEDKFVFLACDGIWDVMSSASAATFLLNRLKVETDLEVVCNNMIDSCLCQNSRDNMTSLLVCFPNSIKVDHKLVEEDLRIESTIRNEVSKIVRSSQETSVISILSQLNKEKWETLPDALGIYLKSTFVIKTLDELIPSRDKSKDFSSGGLLGDLPLALQVVRNIASGQGVTLHRDDV